MKREPMSERRKPKPEVPTDVVRRAPQDRKRLPPDLEAFAASDEKILRRPRGPRDRLDDPRTAALVPGVANRDARAVYDARVRRFRQALSSGAREEAGRQLAEARRLGLWRARSLTGWAAFVENVLELDPKEADALLALGRPSVGEGPLPERVIATFLRTEAGLLEVDATAFARWNGERLVLELGLASAAAALAAVGRRCAPLAQDQADEGPRADRAPRRERPERPER